MTGERETATELASSAAHRARDVTSSAAHGAGDAASSAPIAHRAGDTVHAHGAVT